MRLTGISGSLRRDSYNTSILRTLSDIIVGRATLNLQPISDLPHYDQDIDIEDAPISVARLRDAIDAADGLVIASPEYNHGVPGVLKNAFDWASRPRGRSALISKPILTITSSMAVTGGVRAHAQLNETLLSVAARLVIRPQAVIGVVHTKVIDGRLVDSASLEFLSEAIDDLLKLIDAPSPKQTEQA